MYLLLLPEWVDLIDHIENKYMKYMVFMGRAAIS